LDWRKILNQKKNEKSEKEISREKQKNKIGANKKVNWARGFFII
jgi:hypothetical protein